MIGVRNNPKEIYKHVHQNPELSCKEAKTASQVAKHLESLRYKVHEKIGGHGVVGGLQNGNGPVVVLRAELDALPIQEATNLPYTSTKHMIEQYGYERLDMHARGHDMHLTCLLAASELMFSSRSQWSGTLILLFQPNEEHTWGAQAMLNDGLYKKVQVPDIVLGQHSMPMRTGRVNIRSGPILTAADTVNIPIGSTSETSLNPQNGVNPIDVAARVLVRLESAGQVRLDTVQEAEITLDVKGYKPVVRQDLREAIPRIMEAESRSGGLEKQPQIDIGIRAPLTNNDPEAVMRFKQSFDSYFKDSAGEGEPCRPCEDFSYLATAHNKPYAYWFLGAVGAVNWDRACREGNIVEVIPGNHSPFYASSIQPTLQVGVDALAVAALIFLD
ncbi:MAG: hypothetical protein Q9222_003516 [Ikaeria aurantiellina]